MTAVTLFNTYTHVVRCASGLVFDNTDGTLDNSPETNHIPNGGAMQNRRIGNATARLFGIARYFEDLTTLVVGGARLQDSHDNGIDIEHLDLDSAIEVKGAGTDSGPLVYTEQLDKHLERRGFPFSHSLYALWLYKNTRQNRISRKSGDLNRLYDELSRRTEVFFFVDARLLEGVQRQRGTAAWRRDGYELTVLRMKAQFLRKLAEAPGPELRKLGLSSRSFFIQQASVAVAFEGRFVRFHYTAILPRTAAAYVWPVHARLRQNHPAASAQAVAAS